MYVQSATMDVTDNEDYSDGDSATGDVRNLSMSESHCSDFSDADNTDSHEISDSQSTPLGGDPLAQLLATPEHNTTGRTGLLLNNVPTA